jgi:hypothetical protein
MISTVEEFILLLKKWSADSARVRLIASFADPQLPSFRAVFRLSGRVSGIEEQSKLFRIGDDDEFATVSFGGCRLGYGTGDDIQLSSQLTESEQLEDLVCLVTPSAASICLYTVK